jgi:hypothetical protein
LNPIPCTRSRTIFVHILYNKADVKIIFSFFFTKCVILCTNFHINFIVQSVYKCCAKNITICFLHPLEHIYIDCISQFFLKKK